MGRFMDIIEAHKKKHEDERKLRGELHNEFHKRMKELYSHKAEFHQYRRRIKYSRPVFIIITLLIWYLLFRYAGVVGISVFFAVLISLGGIFELFFLVRIEKRILTPIDKLKNGVEEIAKGNYAVKVDSDIKNEIGLLIDSFNEMAQKLLESEKLKAEYEENRKALIANISHDLKTPVTSIQGYIEAIMDSNTVSQENINKYLKVIYNNSSFINKLIDDLFLFSKLDMQKLDFQFENAQVRLFIKDMMEEFELELEERKIEFHYNDRMEEDCSFHIDRKRLHQVFRNIIGNAVKYGPERNLYISCELYTQDGFVCIGIRDNGPGISEEKLPFIFDRFYRIDTERTKDFVSTGLGLAIAKELVEAHGGKIAVSSDGNAGSCFTVMLPGGC